VLAKPHVHANIDLLERCSQLWSSELRRIADAIDESNRIHRERSRAIAEAHQARAAARRRHSIHVIDDAYLAATNKTSPVSRARMLEAFLAVFQYCKPMRCGNARIRRGDPDETLSIVAVAIRAIDSQCIGSPNLYRMVATAIAREVRGDEARGKERALPSPEPTGLPALGADSTLEGAIVSETVTIVRGVAEELGRRSPATEAAIEYLFDSDLTRIDVAALHGVSVRQVRRAEEHVKRAFEPYRRRLA